MGIRPVRDSDVSVVARIFIHAFPESNFLVYEKSEGVLGYVVVPRSMGRVWAKVVLGGQVFLWALKWMVGKYGISPVRIATILGNKLLFAAYSGGQLLRGRAQVLSVAVDPSAQGSGIGRQLVHAGLDLLRRQGVGTLKLEVRPDNEPARRLYSSLGFRETGRSRDSQGEWTVMVAHL